MKRIKMFFGIVRRRLNFLLVLGAINTTVGFYRVWPHLDKAPPYKLPLETPGEGMVYIGLVLLFCGMMKSETESYQATA